MALPAVAERPAEGAATAESASMDSENHASGVSPPEGGQKKS